MKISRGSQSGQTIVLMAFAIIGLFGFAALALDGGMLYAERRRAQNAADAGALAGAFAKIEATNLHVAALQRINSNGYSTTWGPCDPAGYDCTLGTGEKWTVQVTNPPRSGDFAGDSDYIQIFITSQINSSLAHFVFDGPLATTVEAVSRVRPEQNIAPGHALYGGNPHACKTIWVAGTGNTMISGGNIFSNSDADTFHCQSGVADGTGDVTVNPPNNILTVGGFDEGGTSTVSPTPIEGAPQETLPPVPLPNCSALPDRGIKKVNAGDIETIPYGRYEEIAINAGAEVTMDPGMYCIYGTKGFKGTDGVLTGTGVFIYLTQGPFDLSGSMEIDLRAEDTSGVLVDPSHNDWEGMLLYMDPGNTSVVKITGDADSTYLGTIYAPATFCTIEGNGTTFGISTQVICDTIKITGTAELTVNYDQDDNFNLPPAIDLAR
jgi:hypothetical protein